MRLYLSELYKLVSVRANAVLLIILLAANFALTCITAHPPAVEIAARKVYSLYLDDPESLIEYKEQLEADFFLHLRDDEFEVPSTYIDGADDMSVINKVTERAEYIASYREETEKLAANAEKRARELGYFGYSEESFYVREQLELARVYGDLASVLDGEGEYAYGYDAYFESSHVCLFVMIWLMFAVSFIFRNDGVCGFGSIMRTVRRGRLESALAKLAVTVTVSVVATLLFLATTLLAVGVSSGGFSSAAAPIQLLPDYAKVPLNVSILGYLVIQTVFRLLAAAVFALFAALVASLGFNYVFCFSFGAVFAAANYFLFARRYVGTVPPIKYLNIASAAEGVELFSFHRVIDLFWRSVSYTVVFAVISAVSFILLSLLCAFFYCKNLRVPKAVFVKRSARASGKKKVNAELREFPLLPLWAYELRKNRFIPLSLLALTLLLVNCGFVRASVGDGKIYGEAIYYGYISDIKELSPEQRRVYLAEERASLEAVFEEYAYITEAFEAGDIEYEEYSAFLQEYYSARDREKVLGDVEKYSDYVDRKGCEIVYSTGYERFFSLGTDWFLFAALVFLSIGIFTLEYRSGNCAQIIKTAKKGRRETFFSKLLPYCALGALLGGIFRGAGMIVTATSYELSDFHASLCAIRNFESVPVGITIGEYLIADIICSSLAGMMTAGAVCLISCLLKKTLHSLGAVGILLALPALLSDNGFALVNLNAPDFVFNTLCKRGASAFPMLLVFHIILLSIITLLSHSIYAGNKILGKEKRYG